VVKGLMNQYQIPKGNVIGHWEAQEYAGVPIEQRKTCPGTNFNMTAFRATLPQV
jgi:N-acetyl-anhydromuramyl-L-alanine amidase AmpD